MDCWTFFSRNIQVQFFLYGDTLNHCENRETAYSRSDIVVYPVFIAAAQLRNDTILSRIKFQFHAVSVSIFPVNQGNTLCPFLFCS